ncbi:MAG: hypothetical protein AAGD32_01395 [Planctomycetota bacterium]
MVIDPQRVSDLRRGGLPPVADLAAIVERLKVSAVLRRQMQALAEAAATPRADRPTQVDATGALALVVELADGLERNKAVAAGERAALETRIADGIALFLDPRTVDAGAARLSAMRNYRDLIRRVDTLALPEQELRQLSNVLKLARGKDETAVAMLRGLDAFAEARAVADGIDAGRLPAKLARQLQGMRQRFERQRLEVLRTAGEVGGSSVFDAPPTAFAREAAEHLEMANALAALAEASEVMPTLERAGVRPVGGLDRAVTGAAVALTERSDEAALGVLNQVAALGELLELAEAFEPDAELDRFLGGRVSASRDLVRQGVIELGDELAGGSPTNADAVAALRKIVARWDRLADADLHRRALEQSGRLAAWPDWPGDAETLDLIVEPSRAALAAALVDLAPTGDARLVQVDAEFGPMLAALANGVVAAEAVEATDRTAAAVAGLRAPVTDWSDLRRLRALVPYLEAADDQQRPLVLRTWRE